MSEGGAFGLVSGTIPFSWVDGPGNRFVVFLQGCNFDCVACHNPFTIHPCHHCGECVPVCRSGALSFDGREVTFDPEACSGCDDCLRACRYDSTPKARSRSVDSLLEEIRPLAPYLRGVTVSGGEATQQAPFVAALFAALARDPELQRLSRLIDSNGAADDAVWDLLEPLCDGVMVDLKALDPAVHRQLTGAENALVKRSIERLAAAGKLYEVRLLIVPGFNDLEVKATADYLRGVDPQLRLKVMPFRRAGARPAAQTLPEPSAAQLSAVAEGLRGAGFREVVAVGA